MTSRHILGIYQIFRYIATFCVYNSLFHSLQLPSQCCPVSIIHSFTLLQLPSESCPVSTIHSFKLLQLPSDSCPVIVAPFSCPTLSNKQSSQIHRCLTRAQDGLPRDTTRNHEKRRETTRYLMITTWYIILAPDDQTFYLQKA